MLTGERIAGWRSVAGAAAVLAFMIGALIPAPATAQTSLTDHPPIVIDGDADLCDDEDGDGKIGQDDGIVNCETADGSPERPFVVEGWRITITTAGTQGLSCEGDALKAAVSVCRTTRHLALRSLEVGVTATDEASRGVRILGASNVRLDRLSVLVAAASSAHGLHIGGTSEGEPSNVTVTSSRFAPLAISQNVAPAAALTSRMIFVENADVTIEDTLVNAEGRAYGAYVQGTSDLSKGVRHVFRLGGSSIENATFQGVAIYDVRAEIQGNTFFANGVPRMSPRLPPGQGGQQGEIGTTPSYSIYLKSLDYVVAENEFVLGWPSTEGLVIDTNATGLLEFNRFRSVDVFASAASTNTAVTMKSALDCRPTLRYNDFNGFRVRNWDLTCSIDARRNWWGQETGPASGQADGLLLFDSWLKFPLDALPKIAISSPAPDATVHGAVEVTGTAEAPPANAVVRVEATRSEEDWKEPLVAEGLGEWRLRWDLGAEPLGRLSLWVRACGEKDCGVPVRLDVVHVNKPAPPVALLEALPRVTIQGEPVTLDASKSYSPDGIALVAYRFDFGDGRLQDWSASPVAEVAYDEPGAYVAKVEVRDAENASSANPAEAIVRVLGEDEGGALRGGVKASDGRLGSVPSAEPALAALAIALALLLARRRGTA